MARDKRSTEQELMKAMPESFRLYLDILKEAEKQKSKGRKEGGYNER
jgi:hypothetical protein